MKNFCFRQFLADYLAQKSRIFLTIAAIAIASAAITVMLATGDGLRLAFNKQVREGGVDLLAISAGHTSQNGRGGGRNRVLEITKHDFDLIQQSILPYAQSEYEYRANLALHVGTNFLQPQINGVMPRYGKIRKLEPLAGGRFINEGDEQQSRQVIFLGGEIAKQLFPGEPNPVGQQVNLAGNLFTVIGILQPRLSFVQVSGSPDQFQAWLPSSTLLKLLPKVKLASIILLPNDTLSNEQLIKRVRWQMADLMQANREDEDILTVYDSQALQQKTQLFSTGLEVFLGVIGFITLAMAGVGLANVMTMAVEEATQTIGMRRAVGATVNDIVFYYLLEALLTTALGGLLGLIIAYGSLQAMQAFLQTMPKLKLIVGNFKPHLSIFVLLVDCFVLFLVAVASGILPARKAANIPPSEALRQQVK